MIKPTQHSAQFVSLGSRRVFVRKSGQGRPVVFEAGAGEWSEHWALVSERMEEAFLCISYDRAGLGFSDPQQGCRSAKVLAAELIELLDHLEIQTPAIFVGHSFGASIVRMISSLAPDRIAGIVFVDGWHESFADWERENVPNSETGPGKLMKLIEQAGLFRALNRFLNWVRLPKCPWSLDKDAWKSMLSITNSAQFHVAAKLEARAYTQTDKEIAAVSNIDVPIVSLVARHTISKEQVPSNYPLDDHNSAWCLSSSKLSQLSSNSVLKLLEDTDHMILLVRPDEVVAAIRELDHMICDDIP